MNELCAPLADDRPLLPAAQAFWGWPGWPLLRLAVMVTLLQTAWFYLIYGSTDYITGLRTLRVRVHFDWELGIPLVPASVVVYMSIYVLFAFAPFVLRTRRQLLALAATLMTVTAVGGVAFLLLPAELAYPAPPDDLGLWTVPYRIARTMALKYNLLPSLHVGLFVTCVSIFAPRARLTGKLLLWSWAAALAASTLLLHQHHVLDVVAGWLLGMGGKRVVFDSMNR